MTIFYIAGFLMIAAVLYNFIRNLGKPSETSQMRNKVIEEKVTSIGGFIEKIETSKSSFYPYIQELNQNDGSYHVFYKVTYRLDEETKDGWAVLKLQQSLVGTVGSTTNEWIWNL